VHEIEVELGDKPGVVARPRRSSPRKKTAARAGA